MNRYYPIMQSTSQKTSEWGRAWAANEVEALAVARTMDAQVRGVAGASGAIYGDVKPVREVPHLFIEGYEEATMKVELIEGLSTYQTGYEIAVADSEYDLRRASVKLAEMLTALADRIMEADAVRDIDTLRLIAKEPGNRSDFREITEQFNEIKLIEREF